jgi:pimeloyl-ACP methyl ester carboxylesterase
MLVILTGLSLTTTGAALAFLIYAVIRYTPIIARVFEEKPLFFPLRLTPEPGGQDVQFTTADGLTLEGTYYKARTRARLGVIVFCHEYLSDRWSYLPYADPFRGIGFDVFTFDFRNHGASAHDPDYLPLQWVTDHEVEDVAAALAYLNARPDRDPAGVGLFGVSRGGGAALVAASKAQSVWGVITDGAFPTRGTMLAYILRWAEIYVANAAIWKVMPLWVFRFMCWSGRVYSARRLRCRFPDVEQAVGRLSPRPWLMIHGDKDAYIVPSIARALFAEAREPKEHWFVPKAKHNRCREVAPIAYAERVAGFVSRFAPRRDSSAAFTATASDRLDPKPEPNGSRSKAADLGPAPALSGRLTAHVSA